MTHIPAYGLYTDLLQLTICGWVVFTRRHFERHTVYLKRLIYHITFDVFAFQTLIDTLLHVYSIYI